MEIHLFRRQHCVNQRVVLVTIKRAVDVILAIALVVAGLEPRDIHVDALGMDNRCNRIEKGKIIFTRQPANSLTQAGGGEGAGGDNHLLPFLGRDAVHLTAFHGDHGVGFDPFFHGSGKLVTINRQRPASRDSGFITAAENNRRQHPHFGMQNANRVTGGIIRPEGVGADKLGQPLGFMGIGLAVRAHFMDHDPDPAIGGLPCSLAPGHAAANDVERLISHYSAAPALRLT